MEGLKLTYLLALLAVTSKSCSAHDRVTFYDIKTIAPISRPNKYSLSSYDDFEYDDYGLIGLATTLSSKGYTTAPTEPTLKSQYESESKHSSKQNNSFRIYELPIESETDQEPEAKLSSNALKRLLEDAGLSSYSDLEYVEPPKYSESNYKIIDLKPNSKSRKYNNKQSGYSKNDLPRDERITYTENEPPSFARPIYVQKPKKHYKQPPRYDGQQRQREKNHYRPREDYHQQPPVYVQKPRKYYEEPRSFDGQQRQPEEAPRQRDHRPRDDYQQPPLAYVQKPEKYYEQPRSYDGQQRQSEQAPQQSDYRPHGNQQQPPPAYSGPRYRQEPEYQTKDLPQHHNYKPERPSGYSQPTSAPYYPPPPPYPPVYAPYPPNMPYPPYVPPQPHSAPPQPFAPPPPYAASSQSYAPPPPYASPPHGIGYAASNTPPTTQAVPPCARRVNFIAATSGTPTALANQTADAAKMADLSKALTALIKKAKKE